MLTPIYRNLDPAKPNARREGEPREHLAHRPLVQGDGVARRRAAVRDVSGDRRRHDVGQHGDGLRDAARAHQGAHRRPLCQAQPRAHVCGAVAAREARRAAAARNSQPSSIRWCGRIRKRARKLLFVNQAFTTHFANFYNFDDVRYGQDFPFEASALMNYLLVAAGDPRISGAAQMAPWHRRHVGQHADAALRGLRLRTRSAQDAARDHQRLKEAGHKGPASIEDDELDCDVATLEPAMSELRPQEAFGTLKLRVAASYAARHDKPEGGPDT